MEEEEEGEEEGEEEEGEEEEGEEMSLWNPKEGGGAAGGGGALGRRRRGGPGRRRGREEGKLSGLKAETAVASSNEVRQRRTPMSFVCHAPAAQFRHIERPSLRAPKSSHLKYPRRRRSELERVRGLPGTVTCA